MVITVGRVALCRWRRRGDGERGAPMSQGAYRRVCGAATPKGAAQRGCFATEPTPESNGFPVAGDPLHQRSNGCPGYAGTERRSYRLQRNSQLRRMCDL